MTPRELALCADGYRWRDERAWEKHAVLIAYLLRQWGSKLEPADILKSIHGHSDAATFEQLAGMADPGESFDIMVKRQQDVRAKRT
jgi:hypothetical protein